MPWDLLLQSAHFLNRHVYYSLAELNFWRQLYFEENGLPQRYIRLFKVCHKELTGR